ncbi:MAG: copper chaperone [Micavibrio sp.]|nr:MAG: copper chaperone [Micavibrio sp.]
MAETKTYAITGMTCGKCVARVTEALAKIADDVHVTLKPPQAVLMPHEGVGSGDLNAALKKAGDYALTDSPPVETATEDKTSFLKTYYPLLLIIGFITLVVTLAEAAHGDAFNWHGWMNGFMAGFFIVFAFFKFLDLRGFADAYATYDVLAKRVHGYGYVYPFLELGLGLAYLTAFAPVFTYIATILLMGFGAIGVTQSVLKKQEIRCACLGTIFNLPMSTVTIIENIGMALMAAWMLLTVL